MHVRRNQCICKGAMCNCDVVKDEVRIEEHERGDV